MNDISNSISLIYDRSWGTADLQITKSRYSSYIKLRVTDVSKVDASHWYMLLVPQSEVELLDLWIGSRPHPCLSVFDDQQPALDK